MPMLHALGEQPYGRRFHTRPRSVHRLAGTSLQVGHNPAGGNTHLKQFLAFTCKCLLSPQVRPGDDDEMEEAANFQTDGVRKMEQVQVEGTD